MEMVSGYLYILIPGTYSFILLGVSGLICAHESSYVVTLHPNDVLDPSESLLVPYYSFSSTSILIRG
jgi:hypothetical protein